MLHVHTDNNCQHDLKICATCGNVYCAKCGKEWFKEQWRYVYSGTYVANTEPPKITYYGDTSGTYHLHTS